ncbi:MAG: T9SS type A sorting domain-containing protein, partial [Bacteroidota bacterium]
PIDTYTGSGVLQTSPFANFSYRGAWWNPALGQFEGNGFGNIGILVHPLDATTGFPTGTASSVLAANQPSTQSVGDYDPDANEIIYYFNGSVYRYDRATNDSIRADSILNLPVGLDSINEHSIVYVGCEDREYGIYDFENRRLLYVNKTTLAYNGFTQLPDDAPQRSDFGMSYANGLFWLYASGKWNGYQVVGAGTTNVKEILPDDIVMYPNPASERIQLTAQSQARIKGVQIIDLYGNILRRQSFPSVKESTVDIGDLSKGLYILKIWTADRWFTRSLLIQ